MSDQSKNSAESHEHEHQDVKKKLHIETEQTNELSDEDLGAVAGGLLTGVPTPPNF